MAELVSLRESRGSSKRARGNVTALVNRFSSCRNSPIYRHYDPQKKLRDYHKLRIFPAIIFLREHNGKVIVMNVKWIWLRLRHGLWRLWASDLHTITLHTPSQVHLAFLDNWSALQDNISLFTTHPACNCMGVFGLSLFFSSFLPIIFKPFGRFASSHWIWWLALLEIQT